METHTARVLPLDAPRGLSPPYLTCARDPNLVLQRLRSGGTASLLRITPRVRVPLSVRITTLLSLVVTVLIVGVNLFSYWFHVTRQSCTATTSLWTIYIPATQACLFLFRDLTFSEYIWVTRILITIVGVQSFLTTWALLYYCLRSRQFVILQAAMDAIANSAILLICSLITVSVAEGRRFSQVSNAPAYGPTFFAFVTATGLAVLNGIIFCVIFDWDEQEP